MNRISDARYHLRSILLQVSDTDDKIIIEHVRHALSLLEEFCSEQSGKRLAEMAATKLTTERK